MLKVKHMNIGYQHCMAHSHDTPRRDLIEFRFVCGIHTTVVRICPKCAEELKDKLDKVFTKKRKWGSYADAPGT